MIGFIRHLDHPRSQIVNSGTGELWELSENADILSRHPAELTVVAETADKAWDIVASRVTGGAPHVTVAWNAVGELGSHARLIDRDATFVYSGPCINGAPDESVFPEIFAALKAAGRAMRFYVPYSVAQGWRDWAHSRPAHRDWYCLMNFHLVSCEQEDMAEVIRRAKAAEHQTKVQRTREQKRLQYENLAMDSRDGNTLLILFNRDVARHLPLHHPVSLLVQSLAQSRMPPNLWLTIWLGVLTSLPKLCTRRELKRLLPKDGVLLAWYVNLPGAVRRGNRYNRWFYELEKRWRAVIEAAGVPVPKLRGRSVTALCRQTLRQFREKNPELFQEQDACLKSCYKV